MENIEEFNNRTNSLNRLTKTFHPILATEKLLGINRFTLEGYKLIPPRSLSKLSSLVFSTSVVIWFATFRAYPFSVFGTAFIFNPFRDLPVFVVLAQYWLTSIFTISIHGEINMDTMNYINDLDAALHLNVGDDFYRRECKENIIGFIVLVISHVIFECGDILSDGLLTLSGITIIIIRFFQDLEVLMFLKLTRMIGARLKTLNDLLRNVKQKEKSHLTHIMDISKTEETSTKNHASKQLNRFASLYSKIGEVLALVNDIFNFQILMTLLSAFASIIVVIWAALDDQFKEQFSVNIVRVVIWCTRHICVIIILSFTSEKLLSIRNHTKIMINDIIMDYNQPRQVRLQAKAFMELIEAWPLAISVYDMFFVDITLIVKFISVCTTYLIVVIQVYHFM